MPSPRWESSNGQSHPGGKMAVSGNLRSPPAVSPGKRRKNAGRRREFRFCFFGTHRPATGIPFLYSRKTLSASGISFLFYYGRNRSPKGTRKRDSPAFFPDPSILNGKTSTLVLCPGELFPGTVHPEPGRLLPIPHVTFRGKRRDHRIYLPISRSSFRISTFLFMFSLNVPAFVHSSNSALTSSSPAFSEEYMMIDLKGMV